jgi:uncharacterized protein YcfJ
MEAIKTTARIHPLMAAAAVSVIVVSLAGTAAITGLLPNSRGASETPVAAAQLAPALPLAAAGVAPQAVQPVAGMQPAAYVQPAMASAQPAPAPVIIKETVIKEVPVKTAPKPRPVYHQPTYVRNDAPVYAEPAPRPAAQPNYVAIGTGAVVGGLLGNQVGSGNGRKLATIAGVIGGGMLGNQIANQNR